MQSQLYVYVPIETGSNHLNGIVRTPRPYSPRKEIVGLRGISMQHVH